MTTKPKLPKKPSKKDTELFVLEDGFPITARNLYFVEYLKMNTLLKSKATEVWNAVPESEQRVWKDRISEQKEQQESAALESQQADSSDTSTAVQQRKDTEKQQESGKFRQGPGNFQIS
ncbi:hypothetical protein BT96DRAFT_946694 [Gymnopus androsaceus JB14]|uniref:Uncharacterized protein n=1 Tax=Gymnopus androsaceus JB14 TaxID=1447944 RepID=A0A6A4GW79_9AGAR|nr:hypothetical protein BT96DRAFT_946694 [Gymnopus androsaceus JB14]